MPIVIGILENIYFFNWLDEFHIHINLLSLLFASWENIFFFFVNHNGHAKSFNFLFNFR